MALSAVIFINYLSINIFGLNFHQDQNKWKHKLLPFEISKNDESDTVLDLLIYKNQNALFKKLYVFLGDHQKILSVDNVYIPTKMKIH